MKVTNVKHSAGIILDDYQFADKVKEQVLLSLRFSHPVPQDHSNVKASHHTDWDWEPNNSTFRNLKSYIKEKIDQTFNPGSTSDGGRCLIYCSTFWANVYEKGDYARPHCHKPAHYSFAYFVKAKRHHAPLIFTDSGKRIRPKEGMFVAFPAYLKHHVPKHRYSDTRITLSGNFEIDRTKVSIPT
tara:strand:+ start:70 stop:624 length:555 start_codon:yes stop_codon:yes gene_type:complete